MAEIEVLIRGTIGEIRLNRPEVLNAMGRNWPEAMLKAIAAVDSDPAVGVVLVTGRGRTFSSGLDLNDLSAGRIEPPWFHQAELAYRALETLEKPVIAGIQGYCIGGGLQIAIACDARIAAEDAIFGLPAAAEAFLPGMAPWRLPRLIGMGRARHLVLSGRNILPDEALNFGLVNSVVPRPDLEAELQVWAERYLSVPPSSLKWAKRLINQTWDLPFEAFLEEMDRAMAAVLVSPEHQAARQAWMERNRKRHEARRK